MQHVGPLPGMQTGRYGGPVQPVWRSCEEVRRSCEEVLPEEQKVLPAGTLVRCAHSCDEVD